MLNTFDIKDFLINIKHIAKQIIKLEDKLHQAQVMIPS